MIKMELFELKNLCMDMSELGAANYAKRTAPTKDDISQREAYQLFGEQRVKLWKEKGLIHKIRYGETTRSKILYSYAELLSVVTADKLKKAINT
jgi:hypothetical protein